MQIPRAGRFAPVPRMPLACVFLILAQALSPSPVRGQTPPDLPPPGKALLEIRLVDESVLIGRVAAVDQDQVVLTTAAGVRIEIDRAQIRELRPARGRIAGSKFWREDPSGTRLLFTATGRSLGHGESYVGTYVVVMPFASVGLTDSFTIGAGAPVLVGEIEPVYVAPKLQVSSGAPGCRPHSARSPSSLTTI